MTKRTLGTRASRDLIQQLRDAAGLPKQFDESQVEKELSFMVAILCTSEIDNID